MLLMERAHAWHRTRARVINGVRAWLGPEGQPPGAWGGALARSFLVRSG